MKRRIAAGILALLFTFTAGRVYALVPLIPGVVPLLTYIGVPGSLATAIDFSILLHAGILAITFDKDGGGAATSQTSAPLTVKLNPKDPLPVPAGWAAATAPNIHPVPPSTAPSSGTLWTTSYSGGVYSATFADAVNQGAQRTCITLRGESGYIVDSLTQPTFHFKCTPSQQGFGGSGSTQITCPAGYSLVSGSCNLTNANVVVKPSDNNCQIVRTGNSYAVDTRDPDCATGSPQINPANVSIVPSGVTITKSDGSTASVTLASDGTAQATECYPDIANNKTNCLTTKYSAPDATGKVTLEGVLTNATVGVGNATASTGGATSAGQDTANAKLQDIADKIAAEDAAADAAAAAAPALPPDPATVSSLGLPTSNPFSSALPSSVSNLGLPANSETCVTLDSSLPILGTLHIAPCAVVDVVRPMVNYLIIALGVIGGVLAWMRSDNEAAA